MAEAVNTQTPGRLEQTGAVRLGGEAMAEFTQEDIDDWKRYEKVRRKGKWNMFDPGAQRATGLTSERYMFCLKNYTDLKERAGKDAQFHV